MDRSSGAAIIGSVVVHAGIAGLIALALLTAKPPASPPSDSSVPVQVVSEVEVLGAAPLNPSEDLITEDVATAPVETTAEPTPPPPEPTPPPPAPRPTPTPRPTPPRPQPQPTPQPPRTQPPRTQPQPPRNQPQPRPQAPQAPQPTPGFNPDANAGRLNPSPNNNRRPPATGGGATGNAPRTLGQASLRSLIGQIGNKWDYPCDLPGGRTAEIPVRFTLDEGGRLVGSPRASHPNRAIADGVERAIRETAPFQMPPGYEQQEITITFRAATGCANR